MFETERLRVRPWSVDDTEAAHAMYGDPEVVRYIGNHLWESVESTRRILERVVVKAREERPGMGWLPAVHRELDRVIGAAIIRPLRDRSGEPTEDVEIGWHLARSHWGNGYATELGHGLLE